MVADDADVAEERGRVRRVVFCCGKVYYNLAAERKDLATTLEQRLKEASEFTRKLADLRAAAARDDIPSRYREMQKIRAALG